MKTGTLLVVILSFAAAGLRAQTPAAMKKIGLGSGICFVQSEITGRMNIEESMITFSNHQQVGLEGGQAACVYLRPGHYSFQIKFQNAQHLMRKTSVSPAYRVTLGAGEQVFYTIYPTIKNRRFAGGWRAQMTGKHISR